MDICYNTPDDFRPPNKTQKFYVINEKFGLVSDLTNQMQRHRKELPLEVLPGDYV